MKINTLFAILVSVGAIMVFLISPDEPASDYFSAKPPEATEPQSLTPYLNKEIDIVCLFGQYEGSILRYEETSALSFKEYELVKSISTHQTTCLRHGDCKEYLLVVLKGGGYRGTNAAKVLGRVDEFD